MPRRTERLSKGFSNPLLWEAWGWGWGVPLRVALCCCKSLICRPNETWGEPRALELCSPCRASCLVNRAFILCLGTWQQTRLARTSLHQNTRVFSFFCCSIFGIWFITVSHSPCFTSPLPLPQSYFLKSFWEAAIRTWDLKISIALFLCMSFFYLLHLFLHTFHCSTNLHEHCNQCIPST